MSTVTNTELLIGLRAPDNSRVWTDFCSRYRDILVSFARRLGLHEHDAQDAAQEALFAFATAYRAGKYDRDKGRLRTWLYAIASHKIRDIQRRRAKGVVVAEATDRTGLIERIPDERSMSELWQAEWQRALLRTCVEGVREQVKPTTMQVFELCVLKKRPVDEVASHLGISRAAVLKAKTRVLSRMREIRARLEPDW